MQCFMCEKGFVSGKVIHQPRRSVDPFAPKWKPENEDCFIVHLRNWSIELNSEIDYFMYIAFDMFFSIFMLSDRFNETVLWIINFLIMKVLENNLTLNLLRITIDLVPFKQR